MSKFNQNEVENYLLVEGINAKGYGILSQIVMRDKRLPIESKGIYGYIISFAGAGATAFPSIARMCDELCIGENRFYKFRKFLIDLNYLEIIPQRKDNKRYNNIYKIVNNPKPIEKSLHPQIEGIEKQYPQIEGIQIEGIQNEGTIINSSLEVSVSTITPTTTKENCIEYAVEFLKQNIKNQEAFEKIEQRIKRYLKANDKEKIESYVL